jgi:GxxExxY protein
VKERMDENAIATHVVDAAFRIHRELGPGLLETIYELVLARELKKRGFKVERQVPVPIVFDGVRFEEGFRADIIVQGKVLLELKSVEELTRVHAKQVFTYLKLKGLKLGFVLNFGAKFDEKWDRSRCQRSSSGEPWRLCVRYSPTED